MSALLIIDLQNDFFPGGPLAVPDANEVVQPINELLKLNWDVVIASKDWHPEDHKSFADEHQKKPGERIQLQGLDQILWPRHCVQNTPGSEFVSDLKENEIDEVVHKGEDREIDSYSAFFDNGKKKQTDLHQRLQKKGINHLVIAGVATDYCVKFTVLDALDLGYSVDLVEDCCKGVNLSPNDSLNALEEMKDRGARLVTYFEVLQKEQANSQ